MQNESYVIRVKSKEAGGWGEWLWACKAFKTQAEAEKYAARITIFKQVKVMKEVTTWTDIESNEPSS